MVLLETKAAGVLEAETDTAGLVIAAFAVVAVLAVAVVYLITSTSNGDPGRGGWCPSCRRLGLPDDYYCRRCGRMLRRRM